MIGKYLTTTNTVLPSPFSSPQVKLNIQEMIQASFVVTDKIKAQKPNMAFKTYPDGKPLIYL